MPSITLTRLSGFDRNKKTTIDRDSVSLGTDAGSDLRFDATWDKTVSARHLTLEHRSDGWWLVDASKDGTLIAGRKVTREKLSPGAVLELGRGGPKVQVDFTAAAPAPAPAAVASVTRTVEISVGTPPVIPPPAPAVPPPAHAASAPQAKSHLMLWLAIGGLALVAICGVVIGLLKAGSNATPEQALAKVAADYSDAVALVVIVHPKIEDGKPTPMATAWAVGPRVFATNSHVAKPVLEVLENGGSAYVVINRKADRKLKVVKSVVHPRYEKPELNFEGKQTAVPAYDVGLLYVDEDAPKFFHLAPRTELERLDSGYRIGYLGFPMEGMAGGGVEMRSPVATMQSGIITSVTDYWLAQANYDKRLLVQHNLGAAGGASGSPIFNSHGEVVALLNAGNIIGSVSFETGKVTRAPSGVMVNFAQRVDLLRDIWPDYPKQ